MKRHVQWVRERTDRRKAEKSREDLSSSDFAFFDRNGYFRPSNKFQRLVNAIIEGLRDDYGQCFITTTSGVIGPVYDIEFDEFDNVILEDNGLEFGSLFWVSTGGAGDSLNHLISCQHVVSIEWRKP